jgi:hypothetical protein
MHAQPAFDQFLSFIQIQLRSGGGHPEPAFPKRVVTISRQAGCRALAVAEKLAGYLQARTPKGMPPWTVFDRNLVQKVLEEHKLPQSLARFMPENSISEIDDTIDELFGLHPPSWLLVRQTAETILHLANVGNVIVIGRGANLITARLDYVFHVRLVASLERRLDHIQRFDHLDRKAAVQFIRREDKGRQRYLRKYYHKDIRDPLLYHLVINTDLVPCEKAARIVADAVIAGTPVDADRKQYAKGAELAPRK